MSDHIPYAAPYTPTRKSPTLLAFANHINRTKPGSKGALTYHDPEYFVMEHLVTDEMAEVGMALEETKLEIEIIPAMGRCLDCRQVHHLRDSQGICPTCRSKQFEMLSGREFQIKQIAVEDHYESDQNH